MLTITFQRKCVNQLTGYSSPTLHCFQPKSVTERSWYELGFAAMEAGHLDEAIMILSNYIETLHSKIKPPDRYVSRDWIS